jgi:cytidylate kinase
MKRLRTGGIIIVGPCASGKSSLASGLRQAGWRARQIAQEHSYVPNMWQVLSQPELLIFLDADFETCTRRKSLDWGPADYEAQQARLAHARRHCDLYMATDGLTLEQVLQRTIAWLDGQPGRAAV